MLKQSKLYWVTLYILIFANDQFKFFYGHFFCYKNKISKDKVKGQETALNLSQLLSS